MRISDWSSDVCSSDLNTVGKHLVVGRQNRNGWFFGMNLVPVIQNIRGIFLVIFFCKAMAGFLFQPVQDERQQLFVQIVKDVEFFIVKRNQIVFIVLKTGVASVSGFQTAPVYLLPGMVRADADILQDRKSTRL